LPEAPETWLDLALSYPGIELIPLDPLIVVDAYRLPEPFHKDPADRLIVATARILNAPLLTADSKILGYPHVRHLA
jgi:PIN domain nuclease of toxin-antitoxin system